MPVEVAPVAAERSELRSREEDELLDADAEDSSELSAEVELIDGSLF